MQERAVGFPRAVAVTNSGTANLRSGDTSFLSPQTPPGDRYGSSRGAAYIQLRPTSTNAAPPSTTTYTFDRPTPATGWGFVLGDIDSDQVTVSATDATGTVVPVAALGFRGAFNYCAPGVTPKPSCTGVITDGTDQPTWDTTTGLLRGNASATDSAGASAWFEPTTALSSLTMVFAQRLGSPTYQTWFASSAFDLGGTVTAPADLARGLTVRLFDAAGTLVETTTTDGDGTYSFGHLAPYSDYRVELVPLDGLTSDDPLTRGADLSAADARADFNLRAFVPAPVSGAVRDSDGNAVAEVVVTLVADTGASRSVRTANDGRYLFDSVDGGRYVLSVDAPAAYVIDSAPGPIIVLPGSEAPITNQDFVIRLALIGSISGTVRDTNNQPVQDALITITGSRGAEREVRTRRDGSYTVNQLASDDYSIAITAPPGSATYGPSTLQATVSDERPTVVDKDFTIVAHPEGRISGRVDLDGEAAETPVVITLTGRSRGTEDRVVSTDAGTGDFTVANLPLGTYEVTPGLPAGTDIEGLRHRMVTIDEANPMFDDVTFSLRTRTPITQPSPSPSSTSPTQTDPTPMPSPRVSMTPGMPAASLSPLAATGGRSEGILFAGIVSTVMGTIMLDRRRRNKRDHTGT